MSQHRRIESTGGAPSRTRRIAISIALLGTAAGIAGLGTFGTFTSTTTASTDVNSATVAIALGATGASTNRLTVAATNIVPGDTIQRAVDLSNTGNDALASITLTTTATTSTLLDTDATYGLQMVLDKCSVGWTEAGTSPAFTYTCVGGTTSSVIASRAVIGASLAMSGLASTAVSGSDHLRVTLTFPTTAGNTLQTLSSTISFAFTGTQRTATNK